MEKIDWTDGYLKRIKESKTDGEIKRVIKLLYSMGYDTCLEDNGCGEKMGERLPWEDLD